MTTKTKSTHTAGPWKIETMGHTLRITKSEIEYDNDDIVVLGVDCGDEEAKANARLIASAPDMLEALKYIVAWNPKDWNPEKARGLAMAAIAKAERGES